MKSIDSASPCSPTAAAPLTIPPTHQPSSETVANNGKGFVEPGATYRGDAADPSAAPRLLRATELSVPHSAGDYTVEQLFATSKDGTKVPMFVTHRKGLRLDGTNPTLLYGYGGFNISLEPAFSASRLAWLKAYGGVYVQVDGAMGGRECGGGGGLCVRWGRIPLPTAPPAPRTLSCRLFVVAALRRPSQMPPLSSPPHPRPRDL